MKSTQEAKRIGVTPAPGYHLHLLAPPGSSSDRRPSIRPPAGKHREGFLGIHLVESLGRYRGLFPNIQLVARKTRVHRLRNALEDFVIHTPILLHLPVLQIQEQHQLDDRSSSTYVGLAHLGPFNMVSINQFDI